MTKETDYSHMREKAEKLKKLKPHNCSRFRKDGKSSDKANNPLNINLFCYVSAAALMMISQKLSHTKTDEELLLLLYCQE